ncbi:hypothetical protein Tco_1255658 [Tanacetum coccineum]
MYRSSSEAIAILSKIYDPYQLKDELDQLSVALEEKRISMSSVRYQEVFRNKKITLAFVAGAGVQVLQNATVKSEDLRARAKGLRTRGQIIQVSFCWDMSIS